MTATTLPIVRIGMADDGNIHRAVFEKAVLNHFNAQPIRPCTFEFIDENKEKMIFESAEKAHKIIVERQKDPGRHFHLFVIDQDMQAEWSGTETVDKVQKHPKWISRFSPTPSPTPIPTNSASASSPPLRLDSFQINPTSRPPATSESSGVDATPTSNSGPNTAISPALSPCTFSPPQMTRTLFDPARVIRPAPLLSTLIQNVASISLTTAAASAAAAAPSTVSDTGPAKTLLERYGDKGLYVAYEPLDSKTQTAPLPIFVSYSNNQVDTEQMRTAKIPFGIIKEPKYLRFTGQILADIALAYQAYEIKPAPPAAEVSSAASAALASQQ